MTHRARLWLGAVFALLVAAGIARSMKMPPKTLPPSEVPVSSAPPAPLAPETPPYVLPDVITLDVHAERGAKDEVYLVGSTNLPNGTKLGAQAPGGGEDFAIFVHKGIFRSAGFTDKGGLIAGGKHKVKLLTHFTQFWQSPPVLQLVGAGGVNLKGPLIKKAADRSLGDVNIIDETRALDFPPVGKSTVTGDLAQAAIDLVQDATPTTGDRKAKEDTRTSLGVFMEKHPEMRADGWSATSDGPTSYAVDYSVIAGTDGRRHATWAADLASKTVECTSAMATSIAEVTGAR